MNFWPWSKAAPSFKEISIDTLIRRLEAAYATAAGVSVTPDTCMRSPTVNAIVTAISRRISVSPVRVMRKVHVGGRERKELLPSHPVANLLQRPNDWQSRSDYWLDATSAFVRWGRYYAFKGRGQTGPIRRLIPLNPGAVQPKQDEDLNVSFHVHEAAGGFREYALAEIHHARGASRDFLEGTSPVTDVRDAIALEIAAEEFGSTFFKNGAVPLLIFKFMQGFQGFRTKEDEQKFLDDFQLALTAGQRHKAYLVPKGIEMEKPITTENDKAQFLETRKYQRTVIAGAFGVPPHFVGDLERATFNNVEQQDSDFVINVVMPVAQAFEAAMERDLLTPEDRRNGVIIRFNLDAVQRADFKSRQEGLKIQRESGVISPNDWRERENMNPISEEHGGEDYIRPLNYVVAGEEPADETNTDGPPGTEGAE